MTDPRKSKEFFVLDFLFAAFLCAAVFHLTQKPGLPATFRSSPARSAVLAIDGIPVSATDDIELVLARHHVADRVLLELRTNSGIGRINVRLEPYYDFQYVFIDAAIAFIMFGLGLFAYLRGTGDEAVAVFKLASICVAASMIGTRTLFAVTPAWAGYSLCAMFLIAYSLIPPLFVQFTLALTPSGSVRLRRSLVWFYRAAIAVGLSVLTTFLLGARSGSMGILHVSAKIAAVSDAFLMLALVLGVLNLIRTYRAAVEIADKKKLRWILFGLCAGSAPYVLLWKLPRLLGLGEWIPEELFTVFLALIPISFTIAILKYRVMDIEIWINRSAVYSVVVIGLIAIYAVLITFAARVIGAYTLSSSVIVSVAAAVIVALVFEPLRRSAQRIVDKTFFRVRYDSQAAQKQFAEESRNSIGVQQLGELVIRKVNELIPSERIGFFTLEQPGNRIRLAAHEGFDILGLHGIRLTAAKLKTTLRLPVARADRIERGTPFEAADQNVFRRWGMEIVLSLPGDHDDIRGFLVLGRKKSGALFKPEDIGLLEMISSQAGLAISRISLQQELMLQYAETDRLQELSRLKSHFVSTVSHDLKTPLTSIKIIAQLMQSGARVPQKRIRQYSEVIEGEADRLTRLINSVLDFAKIERGVKEYRFSKVRLNEAVREILQLVNYQFKLQKFTLKLDLSSAECIIRADRDALSDVLLNLLTNAMKYSPKRKNISVSCYKRNGLAAVSVKDRGIGISEEELEKIFDPYYRVKDEQNLSVGGIGIGLSIVKNIMDAHDGHIEVKSTPGRGSTFTLFFPVASASLPARGAG